MIMCTYLCMCVCKCTCVDQCVCISRVSDQNGVSLLYIMLEIHHCGWEPSISKCVIVYKRETLGRGVEAENNRVYFVYVCVSACLCGVCVCM